MKKLLLCLTDLSITMHDVKHTVDVLPFVEKLSLVGNTDAEIEVSQHPANEIYCRQGTTLLSINSSFP